jgi:CheY-like chemotaxis protein
MTIVPAIARPRVLVVDDDADTVESTALLFQLQGFDTDTALSGCEAIERARAVCPDLVLLDIAMPAMDGYEVARSLREIPCVPPPLLVAVTGLAYQVDKRRCAEAGFDLHLSKPVDFAVLQQLSLAVQKTSELIGETRRLAHEQANAFMTFLDLEIEMANTFLDVALTTTNPRTRQRCLAKARKVQEFVVNWVARESLRRPGLEVALADLNARYASIYRDCYC